MKAIIFDTETSGFKDIRIIEAAWFEVDINLTITSRFCQRYNPLKPIEMGAMATHHIMDEELVDCPPYTAFHLPDDLGYMIGHNVDFDWTAAGCPDVKRICTLALCRLLWPEVDSHSQSAMIYYLNRKKARELLQHAHSAETDVANCMRILWRILQNINEPSITWERLWEISEYARVPQVMTFGKHKGTLIKDVPPDYKEWLLKQPDNDPYLIKALRGQ